MLREPGCPATVRGQPPLGFTPPHEPIGSIKRADYANWRIAAQRSLSDIWRLIVAQAGGTTAERGRFKFGGLVVLVVVAALAGPLRATVGDSIANRVLGQTNFLDYGSNVNPPSLNVPLSVAVDQSDTPNRLYVVDSGNHRVLGYRDVSALSNGAPADLVIGQADFHSNLCNNGTGPGNVGDRRGMTESCGSWSP